MLQLGLTDMTSLLLCFEQLYLLYPGQKAKKKKNEGSRTLEWCTVKIVWKIIQV